MITGLLAVTIATFAFVALRVVVEFVRVLRACVRENKSFF